MNRNDFASDAKRKHIVFCAACTKGKGECHCPSVDYMRPLTTYIENDINIINNNDEFRLVGRELPGLVMWNGDGVNNTTFTPGVNLYAGGNLVGRVTQSTITPMINSGVGYDANGDRVVITETVPFTVTIDTEAGSNFLDAVGFPRNGFEPINYTSMETVTAAFGNPTTEDLMAVRDEINQPREIPDETA